MEVLKYNLKSQTEKIVLLEFELTKNLEPSDLENLKLPDPIKEGFSSKLLVISGRGPIWLYGYLIHYFHVCKAVAFFDPRLDGAVVVESHSNEFSIGEVIKI